MKLSKFVCVRWRDACSTNASHDVKEVVGYNVLKVRSVGYLVAEHKDRITLAGEYFEEEETCRWIFTIPRVNIEEVIELMPHKSGLKSYPSTKGHPGKGKKGKKGR